MNIGSSVLHIVVEPATDWCRYVGVEVTMEKLLMVLIVECDERDEHCSVSRLFSCDAVSNFGVDRRQCSACRMFRPKAVLSKVEMDVCQHFLHHELL